jgi:hypothetical protein
LLRCRSSGVAREGTPRLSLWGVPGRRASLRRERRPQAEHVAGALCAGSRRRRGGTRAPQAALRPRSARPAEAWRCVPAGLGCAVWVVPALRGCLFVCPAAAAGATRAGRPCPADKHAVPRRRCWRARAAGGARRRARRRRRGAGGLGGRKPLPGQDSRLGGACDVPGVKRRRSAAEPAPRHERGPWRGACAPGRTAMKLRQRTAPPWRQRGR